jgi:hypothetical protein
VVSARIRWQALPWSLAEIRQLGDWGHASNHLGSAWERFACARLLVDRQPWPLPGGGLYRPLAVVPIGLDENFARQLSAAGQRAPDACVIGRARGRPVIQPVDFKFSLDHAEAGQIAIDVARAAGERLGPALSERLQSALPAEQATQWQAHLVPGVLVAPPSASNRRARVPGRPLIRWLPTAIEEFFPSLPAASVAEWLAQLDQNWPIRDDFDLAEAYYRLGAALAGALGRLARPLFAEGGEIPLASLAAIVAWQQAHNLHSTAAIFAALRPALLARRARERQLAQLLRRPASWKQLAQALGQSPTTPLDQWPEAARRALPLALADDRAELLARGRALVAAGTSEEEALALLQREQAPRRARFLARLRALAGAD